MATRATHERFKHCNVVLPFSCSVRNKAGWKVLASTPTDVASEGCDGSLSHQKDKGKNQQQQQNQTESS